MSEVRTYSKETRGVLATDLVVVRHDARGPYLTVLEYFDSPGTLWFDDRPWERTEECEPRGELVRRIYRLMGADL